MFIQEKKVSEEKLNNLEVKIKEYSDMLEDTTDNKLPSIDENAELEEQVIIFFKYFLSTFLLKLFYNIFTDQLRATRIFQLLCKNRRRDGKA